MQRRVRVDAGRPEEAKSVRPDSTSDRTGVALPGKRATAEGIEAEATTALGHSVVERRIVESGHRRVEANEARECEEGKAVGIPSKQGSAPSKSVPEARSESGQREATGRQE